MKADSVPGRLSVRPKVAPRPSSGARSSPGDHPTPRAIFYWEGGHIFEQWLGKEDLPEGVCAESFACTIASGRGPQLALYDREGQFWSIERSAWNGHLPWVLNRVRGQLDALPRERPWLRFLLVTRGHWGPEGDFLVEMLLVHEVSALLGAAVELHFRSVLMDAGRYLWRDYTEDEIATVLATPPRQLWTELEAVRRDRPASAPGGAPPSVG